MRVRAALAIAAVALAVPALVGSFAVAIGVRYNASGSMPIGFYRVYRGAVTRDAVVVDCLPAPIGAEALRRGYLEPGRCPGGAAAVVKVAAALPGDVVTRSRAGLAVNGRPSPCAAGVLRWDLSGRPLRAVPVRLVVPRGTVFLCGEDRLSWDSRYFGPVPLAGVQGIAAPLAGFSAEPPRRSGASQSARG